MEKLLPAYLSECRSQIRRSAGRWAPDSGYKQAAAHCAAAPPAERRRALNRLCLRLSDDAFITLVFLAVVEEDDTLRRQLLDLGYTTILSGGGLKEKWSRSFAGALQAAPDTKPPS